MSTKLERLRTLLFVHELEQESPDFPSATERKSAQVAAKGKHDPVAEPERYLTERARHLLEDWRSDHPDLAGIASHTNPFRQLRLLVLPLAALSVIIGFFLYQLDTSSEVNLLSVPLLGLIAWSIIACLISLVLWLLSFFRTEKTPLSHSLLCGIRRLLSRLHRSTGDHPGLASFQEKWWQTLHFPLRCRVRSALHLMAVLIALGSVIGLYARGISTEYRVVWESTFFQSGEELRGFLAPLFQPAVSLLGDQFPSADALDALQRSSASSTSGENAEQWIHWYAVTVGLLLGIPRLILALLWRLRSLQAEAALSYRSLPVSGWDRILYEAAPVTRTLRCVAYPTAPDDEELAELTEFLSQTQERKVQLEVASTVSFGEEDEDLCIDGSVDFAIFSLSATPEQETHRAFFSKLQTQHPDTKILLRTQAFDAKNEHLRDAGERRLTRVRAWHKLFSADQVELLVPESRSTPHQ